MRIAILVLVLSLVTVTVNYILKCLEYKDLRDLFVNRGNSIKMLNEEVNMQKIRYAGARDKAAIYESNMDYYKNLYYYHKQLSYEAGEEIKRLKHRVYVLKRDTKRNQRAIVRYKRQNEVYKHGYHETEERNRKLRQMYTTEIQTEQWLREMWYMTIDERDAYLYCLRQIQEEVTNAKEE